MQSGNGTIHSVTMRSNPRLGFPKSEYRRRYDLVKDRMREATSTQCWSRIRRTFAT